MTCSRRRFLRGASGITLGLPFLELFEPKRAVAQSVPKRMLLLATGFSMDVNGSNERETWGATGNEQDLGTLSPILAPFDRHRSRVTVVGGIDNVVAPLMKSNGHNASSKTVWNCYPAAHAIDGQGNLRRNTEVVWNSEMAGPSIDHELARGVGTPLLPLSVGSVNNEHRIRWRAVGNQVVFDEGVMDPQAAFDSLFGGITMDAAPDTSPLARLRQQRRSVLDAVLGQFRSLERRAGAADRMRLERHAELVRSVEQGLAAVTITCQDPQLSLPSDWNRAAGDLDNGDGIYDDIILKAMGQVVGLAFACQATQVASLHMRNMHSNTFPWLNGGRPFLPANFHAVTHHEEGTAEQRLGAFRWHASAFSELVDTLQAIDDGPGGSLMDSTAVVWVSTLRHSWHSTDDLPVVIVGDLQGSLRSNRVVDYQAQGGRSLGDLYTTLLNAMDVPATSFGWNRGEGADGRPLNRGPLAELLS